MDARPRKPEVVSHADHLDVAGDLLASETQSFPVGDACVSACLVEVARWARVAPAGDGRRAALSLDPIRLNRICRVRL
jgi:hypothetical protein